MQIFPSTINRNTPLSLTLESGKRFPWLAFGASLLLMLLSFEAMGQAPTPTPTPAPANRPCPTEFIAPTLQKIPEIISADGKLRGTIILSDEQEWIPTRIPVKPPQDKSRYECSPQYVRTFRELGATPKMAAAPKGTLFPGSYALPRPGPTLRARVGEVVQLSFINQIDTLHFGDSIDRAERGRGNGCDEVAGIYPGKDKFPDCFHGSSTGNIHFHGTHTNPNATGDNVFIEVRPSLRVNGKPIVTPESVANSFSQFFTRCEAELDGNVLREWPASWNDLPKHWTEEQKWLLNLYDTQMRNDYGPGVRPLWPVDAAQLKVGAWPQYYIGAYPYCFRLPEYKEQTWPPPKTAPSMAGMNMPSDDDAGTLMMGQSPGTHWYHAHKHGSTAINVANGMTGAFIIEGQYDDDLNTWYGTNWTRAQKVLVINQLGVSPNLERGKTQRQDKGPDFEVNGQLKPIIDMRPGEVQMWRIVNTSGRAGVYFLGPPGTPVPDITTTDVNNNPFVCPKPAVTPVNFEWKQLAQDGVQFKNENYQKPVQPFVMAAGNRVDLLVKAPATPCPRGATCVYPVTVQNEVDPQDLSSACPLTLMSIRISGAPVDPKSPGAQFIPTAPKFPAFLQDISDTEIKGTKTLSFGPSGPGSGTQMIDGKLFDGEIGEVILLNKAEEWKIANTTVAVPISHPFHIHINPFQVVEVFDPNEILTDDGGKPVIDPVSKQPVFKYVFQGGIHLLKGQCPLDPFGSSEDWKPCGPRPPNKDNIWWDVFPIPSARSVTAFDMNTKKSVTVTVPGYFKMRSRFVDYPGQYVLHCHILAHEDRGMMNIVEVVPYKTPYSHQ